MRILIPTIAILFAASLAAQDTFTAIAGNPGSMAAWDKLANFMAIQGTPLHPFRFDPPFSISNDTNDKMILTISPSALSPDETQPSSVVDGAAWMEYIQSKMPQDLNGGSDFQLEVKGWERLLKMADYWVHRKKALPKDPILVQFSIFRRDNQLEPAVFLLLYRESFRPDFETWKKENPNGILYFIQKYHLRPFVSSLHLPVIPEETTAVGTLHGTIIRAIQVHHDNAHPGCKYSKELYTQVLVKNWRTHDYNVPVTIEAWTIETCSSKRFTYKVEITRFNEHSYVQVSNIDGTVIDPKP